LSAVDEKGNPLGEELTLALAVQSVLEKNPGLVVVNSLTSQVVNDVADSFGVECHRTRVGEANVAAGMKELGAVVGGEGNGGIILPELHLVRDAGVGMALILNRLAGTKKGLEEAWRAFPEYKMQKVAYPLRDSDADEIIRNVATFYDHDQLSRIDGLRVTFEDGWGQVRPSNTEPILRVYTEARTMDKAKELMHQMLASINETVGEIRIDV
ncbi:MAG TPA: phosphoglucosamine mutase, partial [Bacteroidetes bacterium]|nr:phosphoglucosamine mutase [Bacteroidota bacterium]